jgi:hypothetical protein
MSCVPHDRWARPPNPSTGVHRHEPASQVSGVPAVRARSVSPRCARRRRTTGYVPYLRTSSAATASTSQVSEGRMRVRQEEIGVTRSPWSGSYHRRAKRLREAAYGDPGVRCRRCGLTYAQAVTLWGKQGAAWQAGHVVDGHPGSPLAAEHARCNTSAGGRLGVERKAKRAPRSPNA